MAERFPGGVISKTPPTVVAPVDGEGGSASGVWTLDEVLGYEKAGAWPGRGFCRGSFMLGGPAPMAGSVLVMSTTAPALFKLGP
jgi:hypothetical protein